MKKTTNLLYVTVLTIIFIFVISYILLQNNTVEIPYIYLEF